MKHIKVSIDDELFYKISELKANLKCDTWVDFYKKILKKLG